MDMTKLRDALAEAQQGLELLRSEIQDMQRREKHLDSAVSSLTMFLGSATEPQMVRSLPAPFPLDQPEPQDAMISDPSGDRPNWEIAKELLDEQNRPMTIPEMMNFLAPRGHKIKGDGLRVAMIRRPDMFRKNGYGRYGLTAWPTSSQNDDVSHFLQPDYETVERELLAEERHAFQEDKEMASVA